MLLTDSSIREFTGPQFPVYMYDGEGNHKVMTMDEVSGAYKQIQIKKTTNTSSYSPILSDPNS